MIKHYTRGNVIIEDIKIGDTHYEYDYDTCIITEVVTLPIRDENGIWRWKSKKINTGEFINYAVNEKYSSSYGPKLYDYKAYEGIKYI